MLYAVVFVQVASTFLFTIFGGRLIQYKQKEMLDDIKMTIAAAVVSALPVLLITILTVELNLYISFALQLMIMGFSYLLLSVYFFQSIHSKEAIDIAFMFYKNIKRG